jgi:hypothetical protein
MLFKQGEDILECREEPNLDVTTVLMNVYVFYSSGHEHERVAGNNTVQGSHYST